MKNLFIGIDFSKEKVDVAIIFADGLTEAADDLNRNTRLRPTISPYPTMRLEAKKRQKKNGTSGTRM